MISFVSFSVGDEDVCQGCVYGDDCFEVGEEFVVDGVLSYCSINGEIVSQKEDGEICDNDFECLSNLCSNGECVDLYGEIKKKEGLIEEVGDREPPVISDMVIEPLVMYGGIYIRITARAKVVDDWGVSSVKAVFTSSDNSFEIYLGS